MREGSPAPGGKRLCRNPSLTLGAPMGGPPAPQCADQQDVVRVQQEVDFGHTYWWPYGESGLYQPLTALSYLFNYAMRDDGGAGQHGVESVVRNGAPAHVRGVGGDHPVAAGD